MEVRISWYPIFVFLIYFSRGTLPTKKRNGKRALLGDLEDMGGFCAFIVRRENPYPPTKMVGVPLGVPCKPQKPGVSCLQFRYASPAKKTQVQGWPNWAELPPTW